MDAREVGGHAGTRQSNIRMNVTALRAARYPARSRHNGGGQFGMLSFADLNYRRTRPDFPHASGHDHRLPPFAQSLSGGSPPRPGYVNFDLAANCGREFRGDGGVGRHRVSRDFSGWGQAGVDPDDRDSDGHTSPPG